MSLYYRFWKEKDRLKWLATLLLFFVFLFFSFGGGIKALQRWKLEGLTTAYSVGCDGVHCLDPIVFKGPAWLAYYFNALNLLTLVVAIPLTFGFFIITFLYEPILKNKKFSKIFIGATALTVVLYFLYLISFLLMYILRGGVR